MHLYGCQTTNRRAPVRCERSMRLGHCEEEMFLCGSRKLQDDNDT